MHTEIEDSPWWVQPYMLRRKALKPGVKFEDYVKDLKECKDINEVMMDIEFNCYLRGTMFESEHAYISATNKMLAARYYIRMSSYTAVRNLTIKVDANVKKVILTIGNTNVWEKKVNEEDVKRGNVSIGGPDACVPIRYLMYMQVAVVIVTTHQTRNALFDAAYALEYDNVQLAYLIDIEFDGKRIYCASFDFYIENGSIIGYM